MEDDLIGQQTRETSVAAQCANHSANSTCSLLSIHKSFHCRTGTSKGNLWIIIFKSLVVLKLTSPLADPKGGER